MLNLRFDEIQLRQIIGECFRREAPPEIQLPEDFIDLVESGILDSMAWVGFLRALESATGTYDLGNRISGQPASIASILKAIMNTEATGNSFTADSPARAEGGGKSAFVVASSAAFGSRTVPSEEVDRAFGMPIGKLRKRAGIESLAYAAAAEDEAALASTAGQEALRSASCPVTEIDWIIATSETHRGYPSLAAELHSRLLARETCGALDVGGACLGLLNALATAQAFIASGRARTILIATADVHSRVLIPGRVAGEFGGLFGDGASAFLLKDSAGSADIGAYRLGEFTFGCAGQYAAAIRLSDLPAGQIHLQFDGEALSRAAILRMERSITDIELRSGISRHDVAAFATHQPNPRLVALLAKQCGVPYDRFPPVAATAGNLGATTCGAALHAALM